MATSPPETAAQETAPEHGAAAYRRVLHAPGVVPLAAAAVLARLPIGMGAIALVLYLQHETGSFAAAGAAAAAFAVGLGLTAPVLGRLVDHRGRGLIFPAALVSSLALAGVVALGSAGAATWLLVASAGLAGAAEPPLGGVFRHRLPDLVAPADVPTAYAVDSILIEIFFIAGPLLAGGLAATAGPAEALLAAALLGLAGSAWFAALMPPHRPDPDVLASRPRGGALSSPAIRILVLGGIPVGASFGALDVALPAFGVAHGSAALGGPFAAALAFGSAFAGVAYGARPRALGPPRTAILRLAALQAVLALPLLFAPSVAAMFVLAAISGICVAPLVSVRSELVRKSLPPGTGNEAFSWVTVSIAIGASVGSALAGPLVESGGWRVGVALACAAPAVGFLVTFARRHVL
ncbi:MAG TPA: MFS transporter [Solirubrobacterales bacterium]|jgi:MFS family permease